jgi:hypothetical protein
VSVEGRIRTRLSAVVQGLAAVGADVAVIDTTVWLTGDMYTAMRASLAADRMQEHQEAHARGQALASIG